jgi:hypothetical protein
VVPTGSGWSARDHRRVKSWRGVGIGGCIALAVPAFIFVLSLLVNIGVLSADQVDLPWITWILVSELVIGPIGIMVAGWSAGVRGMPGWVLLLITAVPLLAGVWVASALIFGGATGSPF